MIDEKQFVGSWVHAHEEDDGGVQVFRPAATELPPSRGRRTFTLQADRRATVGDPGSDDRGTLDDGAWSLDHGPEGTVLSVGTAQGRSTYAVLAVEPDVLRLRPFTPS